MRKTLSQILVLVLSSFLAFSQARNITGKITDATGAPVPYASVKIQSSGKGVTADENGNFTLEVSQGEILQISAVGVQPTTFTVGAENAITVLVEKTGTLNEVVVTALNIRRQSPCLWKIPEGSAVTAQLPEGSKTHYLLRSARVWLRYHNPLPMQSPLRHLRIRDVVCGSSLLQDRLRQLCPVQI